MLVLVNPTAGGGRAVDQWPALEPVLRSRHPAMEVRVVPRPTAVPPLVRQALARGERFFVAAGGDGTVQQVLQALLDAADREQRAALCLGAIGLGSSNDFHKPLRQDRCPLGVPCKLDATEAAPRDVGVLTVGAGPEQRYWLLNGSVGVTAQANAFFNAPDRPLAWLKRRATPLAILYAALYTLLTYHTRTVRLTTEAGRETLALTNLAVVKSPYCSGAFRYDSPLDLTSGELHVHVYEAPSRLHTLRTLGRLARGRFQGRPGTRSWTASRLDVTAERPFAVEFDGEVLRAQRVSFSVQQGPRVCP